MPRSKGVSVANLLSDGVCMDLQWDLEMQQGVDRCAWVRLRGLGPIRCTNGMKIEVPHPPQLTLRVGLVGQTPESAVDIITSMTCILNTVVERRKETQPRTQTALGYPALSMTDATSRPVSGSAPDVFADVADWIFSAAFHATRSLSSGHPHVSRDSRESISILVTPTHACMPTVRPFLPE